MLGELAMVARRGRPVGQRSLRAEVRDGVPRYIQVAEERPARPGRSTRKEYHRPRLVLVICMQLPLSMRCKPLEGWTQLFLAYLGNVLRAAHRRCAATAPSMLSPRKSRLSDVRLPTDWVLTSFCTSPLTCMAQLTRVVFFQQFFQTKATNTLFHTPSPRCSANRSSSSSASKRA